MPDADTRTLPLTAAQEGIWLGQCLAGNSAVYNAAEYVDIQGGLDAEAFLAAAGQAAADAPALGMRIVTDASGQPRQVPGPPAGRPALLDFSAEADPAAAAMAWMERDRSRHRPMDGGGLFGQALLQLGGARWFWYLRAHHVLLDGFGFALLRRRTAAIYRARVTGTAGPPAFGALREVIDEDRAYAQSAERGADRDFWLRQLAGQGAPATPGAGSGQAADNFLRRRASLDARTWQRLKAAARTAGVSWAELLMAATAGHLHRQTGAAGLVMGLPVMARMGSAAARTPCMAMNILPLRLDLAPDDTLTTLGRRCAGALRAIRPHQRYRYEALRRDLGRVGGGQRLFGPVVNIMPFDTRLDLGGPEAVAHNLAAGPVEDLALGLRPDPTGGLSVEVDANPEDYSPDALDRQLADWQALVTTAADSPGEAIAAPARQPADRQALIQREPRNETPDNVVTRLRRTAARRPHAAAVAASDRTLDYATLLARAEALADELHRRGAAREALVAIALPRGADAVIAVLGALLSGAAYVALDPDGPAERNRRILAECRPVALITDATGRPLAEQSAVPMLNPAEMRPGDTAAGRPRAPSDADLAYVLYTSGSTGRPKGVMVAHGALAHFVAAAGARYGITGADRVLQFAPLHFDTSVEEILVTLCAGATLVIRPPGMPESVPAFLTACGDQGITVLDLPTAYWHELAYALDGGAAELPGSVHTVIIGGEAALPERLRRWQRTVGDSVRLLNTYGPSEATVVALSAELQASRTDTVPIGRPLPGGAAAVLDDQGRPVAQGECGELWLVGPGLARGYLGNPELTAERFQTLTRLPGSPRAYRTGDLAYVNADAALVFAGRRDDELKISGHRVDPGEVESALLACHGVVEAAVTGSDDGRGNKRLGAALVAQGEPAGAAALRAELAGRLPGPLIPTRLCWLEHLPRTSSGKIDRARVAALIEEEEDPPATAGDWLEQAIMGIWSRLLGRPLDHPAENVFDAGGQSLQCIQAANRLRVLLGRGVPVDAVFRRPTAADLAAYLRGTPDLEAEPDQAAAEILALRSRPDGEALFCLPPAGGFAWCYTGLAAALPAAAGVYGLQPEPEGDVEFDRLAAHCVDAILRVRPQGPYHLLGWSLGGTLAHGVACRLQGDGQTVASLTLLDAAPAPFRLTAADDDTQAALLAVLEGAGVAPSPGALDTKRAFAALEQAGHPLAEMGRTAFGAFVERVAGPIGAARRGRSGVYDGDVLYFAAGRGATPADPERWRDHVAGTLQVTTLDTDHAGMTGAEAVASIAPAVRARLHGTGNARRNSA